VSSQHRRPPQTCPLSLHDALPISLVVPEINGDAIRSHRGIIANPNCAAIISITPLWPIHRENPIRRLILSTYQSASGAGAAAMRSEEHTSELQSRENLVCRLLLEK